MENRVWQWKFFQAKTIAWFLLIVIVFIMGDYIFFQGKGIYDKVSSNWDSFQFTYNHPSIVQTIEKDFASRSAQLESSYTTREKTPEQVLIEQVAKQLQPSK